MEQKFTLIENAYDSLKHAVSHIKHDKEAKPEDWKRVILDISHAIELLLKEYLRNIHPAFIVKDIDKYTKKSNDFQTIGFDLCLKRMSNIANISFSDNEIKSIKLAKDKRNQIQHYEFKIDPIGSRSLVGELLLFIFDFSLKYLKINLHESYLNYEERRTLEDCTDFYKKLIDEAHESIEANHLSVITCIQCYNDTFSVDDGKCLVCHYQEEVLYCSRDDCNEPFLMNAHDHTIDECFVNYEIYEELCPSCLYLEGYAAANHEKY
jgi:hypothetical protein|tara:strand:+ start:5060 stop:5854 length:795 start_codon:yes stop_codon:yes gene_type:complete